MITQLTKEQFRLMGVALLTWWAMFRLYCERDPSEADAEHSLRGGLLWWLMSGKRPFAQQPPRKLSRPDYEFALKTWGDPGNLTVDFDLYEVDLYVEGRPRSEQTTKAALSGSGYLP